MFFIVIFVLSIVPFSAHAKLSLEDAAAVFSVDPEITNVQISPNGDRLLIMQMYEGKKILVTKSLSGAATKVHGIPLEKGEYEWARWATNDRIVASTLNPDYSQNSRSMELHDGLISFNWDGSDVVNLVYHRHRNSWYDLGQGKVLDWLMDDPDHLFTTIVGNIYKLNFRTNEYTEYYKTSSSDRYYYIGGDGHLRYIVKQEKGGRDNQFDLYRKSGSDRWLEIPKHENKMNEHPLRFEGLTDDPSIIFMSKFDERGIYSLYRYNVDTKELVEKMPIDTDYPVLDFIISKNGEFEGYSYFDGKERTVYISSYKKHIANIMEKSFPDTKFQIQNTSRDNQKSIVFVSSPVEPGSYYLLDLSSNKLELIGYIYQKVDPSALIKPKIVEFETSDNIKIQGYVTLPSSESQNTNFPTVILPHDGPEDRDTWNFNPLIQFLTSQGYAVFQLNYRGSTGYGKKFIELANHEWGRRVIMDINEGTKWIIEQGYADPENICVVGKNYGGYAALQASILDKELYKCVIATSPLTDLFASWNGRGGDNRFSSDEIENFRKKGYWSLSDVSPGENIKKIHVPVLVLNTVSSWGARRFQYLKFINNMTDEDKDITSVDYTSDNFDDDNFNVLFESYMQIGQYLQKYLH